MPPLSPLAHTAHGDPSCIKLLKVVSISRKMKIFSSLPKVNTNHKAIRLNVLNHELYVFNATQIEIFDLKGKNIFSKNVTENALISLRNFPKGMLLVRAIGQGVHYSKIITNP